MSYSPPAAARDPRQRARVLALLLAAVLVVALGRAAWVGSSSAVDLFGGDRRGAIAGGAVGKADGVVPDGVTAFDDVPAVTKLDPALLAALRDATKDAARDGVRMYVDSGWRSARYQRSLLDEAISKYGSAAAAARWVATPRTSAHVAGEAVDVGHSDAAHWLSVHGAAYGLCQVYANEPWHFELRREAAYDGCPSPYADAAHDPRMR